MSGAQVAVHVVDDDPAVLDSIAFLLRAAGFAVETHGGATSLLTALDGYAAACVVLDVRMSEIDGLEVARRLAEREPAPAVILVTGEMEVEPLRDTPGVFCVLSKPLDGDRLLACVERALGRP